MQGHDLRDNKGFMALHFASKKGHVDIVQLLIENGANINERTLDGTSALMLACLRRTQTCD